MRVIFLIGQSNTGKDTIMNLLLKELAYLKRYVYNTTRPMREGEKDGVTYNFKTYEGFQRDLELGKVIEYRKYEMADGRVVVYYTPAIKPDGNIYLLTGTVDMCKSCIEYYGSDIVVPIMLQVSDRERLMRGILREDKNKGDYKEVARRFYDEFTEYNDENINSIENLREVENVDLKVCISELKQIIESYV